ncbi:unnamed protein product, partial [Amoebophrya sp. A25]
GPTSATLTTTSPPTTSYSSNGGLAGGAFGNVMAAAAAAGQKTTPPPRGAVPLYASNISSNGTALPAVPPNRYFETLGFDFATDRMQLVCDVPVTMD